MTMRWIMWVCVHPSLPIWNYNDDDMYGRKHVYLYFISFLFFCILISTKLHSTWMRHFPTRSLTQDPIQYKTWLCMAGFYCCCLSIHYVGTCVIQFAKILLKIFHRFFSMKVYHNESSLSSSFFLKSFKRKIMKSSIFKAYLLTFFFFYSCFVYYILTILSHGWIALLRFCYAFWMIMVIRVKEWTKGNKATGYYVCRYVIQYLASCVAK